MDCRGCLGSSQLVGDVTLMLWIPYHTSDESHTRFVDRLRRIENVLVRQRPLQLRDLHMRSHQHSDGNPYRLMVEALPSET
jgi:hypothetical protein